MTHSFLFTVQVVMLAVGMIALLFPTPEPERPVTLARLLVTGGLILVEVMLAVMALWSRRNWRRVVRLLSQERRTAQAMMPAHIEAAAEQILETAQQVQTDAEDIRDKAVEMQEGTDNP